MLALALIACGAPGDPSPTTCDGISSEIGGCDEDRPAYAGETCEEVGREYGAQLSRRSLELFNGPEDPEESRAVRAWQLNILTAQLANKHLRDHGIVDECEADVFLAAAEAEFSPEFRDQAGTYLFDGPPVSYAEWRAEILDLISGFIDQEEDVPYDETDRG